MADVKTADKTVKHIGQDATDMPEAMKGVQAPYSGVFFAGCSQVCMQACSRICMLKASGAPTRDPAYTASPGSRPQ